MNDENYLNYNDYVLTEIIQGYYFFQYREGVLSVYDLLIKSGDVADAGGDSTDCEFFYNLLNQIDTKPDIVSDNVFNKVINDYFTPLYEVTLEQKRQLESCTLEDLIIEND